MNTWKFLFALLREHKGTYSMGAIALLITLWASLSIPIWIKRSIDTIQEGSGLSHPLFLQSLIWLMVLGLVIFIFRTTAHTFFFAPSRQIEHELKNRMLKHLLGMHHQFFMHNPKGELISRINNDITGIRLLMGFGLLSVFNSLATISITPWLMFKISPRITLYILAPILLVFLGLQISLRILKKYQFKHMEILRKLSDFTLESFKGLDVLRSYRGFGWAEKGFADFNLPLRDTSMKMARFRSVFMPILRQMVNLLKVLILLLAAGLLATGEMSIGDFTAYTIYLSLLVPHLVGATFMLFVAQRGMVALHSIRAILDAKPEPPPISPAQEPFLPAKLKQGLVVQGLAWCYPDAPQQFILKDISFKVSPGEVVGVFGLIGQGKSTLANLLCGWLCPPAGTIFLDGVDICQLSLATLRRQVLLVTQDPQLFSDTIEANIAFGKEPSNGTLEPKKSTILDDLRLMSLWTKRENLARNSIAGKLSAEQQAEILEAAKTAGLAPDLARLPQGLKTMVGEMGITLSGGQKQRVALARSMLNNCGMLVLDDVLSAVDYRTERGLIEQIYKFQNAQSTLIISHRISALEQATRILVLNEGQIETAGRHQELIKQKGHYRDAWLLQRELSFDDHPQKYDSEIIHK